MTVARERRLRAALPARHAARSAPARRTRRWRWSGSRGSRTRRPGQLSGGQQQRVALARALVLAPPVLLLDEPLGALDARLRVDLQVELKRIQETLGITFVYVTHDQDEALTMSDRVAVMRGGRIEQCGEPQRDLRASRRPRSWPNFLGASNLIPATVAADGGAAAGSGSALHAARQRTARSPTGEALAMIRPERVRLERARRGGGEPRAGDGRGGRLPRLPPARCGCGWRPAR